ncbi:MAG TPA: saccharopine dehydrogenase NADP-binding domain-containing protein [Mycobacteriales bacterium]|nr:saccharopine dehydrogenase NADP-binding domain-containing protein [Mycobacteriales bacterium]
MSPDAPAGPVGLVGPVGVVGVVGASGVVGRAAAAALRERGVHRLRLGGRGRQALRAVADTLGPGAEPVGVDVCHRTELVEFCRGCQVVLNCTGPSYLVGDRVARAALAAGADYVDVAGDVPVHRSLAGSDLVTAGRTVVLSAGMLPGLSGLVPRWLAERCPGSASRLTAWTGGLDECGRTVATDLLLSGDEAGTARYGQSLAAWRAGRVVTRVLRPAEDVELPFFPGRVSTHPFLSAEAERLAGALGLSELDWFTVFPGSHLRRVLGRLGARVPSDAEALAEASDQVVRASRLDLAGRRPYYRLAFALDSDTHRRGAVVHVSDSYRLTATVAVLALTAIARGRVPPGLHYAAEVLDPTDTVDRLRRAGAVDAIEIVEPVDGADIQTVERGAL